MKQFIIKILVLSVFLVIGCQNNDGEQKTVEWPEYPEWQVYNENNTINNETIGLVGKPYMTDAVYHPVISGWDGTIPTSTTLGKDTPWEIEGEIKNGLLTLNFLEEELILTENYGSEWTNGIKIAEIHITLNMNQNAHVALKKYKIYNRIYIYYVDSDFDKFNGGTVHLKKGWNFVEIIDHNKIGIISQNINDFIKRGYRWQIELWY